MKSTNDLFQKIEIENKYILEKEKKNILLDQLRKNKFQKNKHIHIVKPYFEDHIKHIKTINFKGFYSMCYSIIDSNTLAIGSTDETIKIWNINESRCIKTLEGHIHVVDSLELIDSNTLASGSHDKTIKIWNLNNSRCIKTLKGHTESVKCLELIDTYTIASGSYDKTIKIWNLNNSRCIKTLEGHITHVDCLDLIDSNTIVSGSFDKTIKIWNLNNSKCIKTFEYDRHESMFENIIIDLKLLDDKNTLVCLMNKKLKFWSLNKI